MNTQEDFQEYCYTEELVILHNLKINADDKYYNTGEPILTDERYDILKETLRKRDPVYIVPIGAKIREGTNRVELPFWLGSMDKYKPDDYQEIVKWANENSSSEYIVENKLDGVSCLVIIRNRKLKLYTRGDGIIGADISYLAQFFDTIPKNITEDIAVRGELIMKTQTFNAKYACDYANPRNMVSGRLGAKTIREGLQDIDFIAYEIVGYDIMDRPIDQLYHLSNIGFTVVHHEIINNIMLDELEYNLQSSLSTTQYQIDGLIIQPNILYERNRSGNPDYAFAFKMTIEENLIDTVVIDVEWNISKWGILKPRVKIEPVSLGGVTINYTSGFNGKYIFDNNIGTGAIIKITRSGDVIPYIVSVVTCSDSGPKMPDVEYEWNETGVDIFTTKNSDISQIKLISEFFAKLGIKHVSQATVQKLYINGYDSLMKIIGMSKLDMMGIDTFGDKLTERTYNNIHSGLQNISISLVLGSSGIFGFGLGRKRIDILFETIPDILSLYKKVEIENLFLQIMNIDGFSEKSAQKILDNIQQADFFIQELSSFATFKTIAKTSDSLKNEKFIMSGFRDKQLEADITNRGGKSVSSISKNTSGLIVRSKDKSNKKIQKARELEIPIYTREEFITKYIDT